jgi:hypothetical protein
MGATTHFPQNRGEDFHHLPIAIGGARELAADLFHGGRQHPVLERRAVPQGAGLPRQDGQ